MKKTIMGKLDELEKKHNVQILWAIESGSRAWGFASKDSDYDVRCVHVGRLDNYLSLNPPPEQINYSENELDIESWDIKKFSRLAIKSNPQIAEWVRSPIVYIDSPVRAQLKKLFDEGCSPEYLRQHYLHMAKQNYKKYMGLGMSHSCKKYLYVLRGIACANYLEKEKTLPPLPYKEVITYLPKNVQQFFEKCVLQKNTTEKAEIIAQEDISHFIERSILQKLEKPDREFKKEDELNSYLIKIIKQQNL